MHDFLLAEQGILRSAEFTGLQWEEQCAAAPLADVLRVHDWNYVKHLQAKCNAIPAEAAAIGRLDMDTAISHASFATALVAAGAVCRAIDAVVANQARFTTRFPSIFKALVELILMYRRIL